MTRMTLAVLFLFPIPATAQDAERSRAENRIRNLKVSLDYNEAPLREIVDFLRDLTDVNFLLDAEVGANGESLVSIKLKDIPVRSALSLILGPRDLVLLWKDGVFLITTKEKAAERTKLRIYDVRDLMHPIQDFPGVDLMLSSEGIGTTFTEDEPTEQDVLPLEEIVQAHTGGKSWEENDRATVSLSNGLLIVRQTSDVHRKIRRLLNKLRRNK